jgi:hypothetical protein
LRNIPHHAALIVLLLVSFTRLCFSQTVFETYLESEEEIEEAYQQGELTYDQYQDILDLYFDKVDPEGADLKRLEALPGATESDLSRLEEVFKREDSPEKIAALLGSDFDLRGFLPFVNLRPPTTRDIGLRAYWQTNVDLPEEAAESAGEKSRALLRVTLTPHYEIFLQGEKRDLGRMGISKRYLKVQGRGLFREVVLGNFTAGYGNGLNLGRYDYWRYNTDSYWEEEGDLLIPNSTWYNGIKLSLLNGRFRPDLIYSYSEGDSLKRKLVGTNVSLQDESFSPGIAYSFDVTEDEKGGELTNECLSLHASLGAKRTELKGEAALLNWDQFALDLRFSLRDEGYSSEFALWGYSNGFVNFHVSSGANPDYFTVYFEEVDYHFRSPQAGEIGFSSSSKFRITDRLSGRANLSGWGNRVRDTNNHDLQVALIAELSRPLTLRFDQFIRGRDNPEEPYQSYTSQLEVRSSHLHDFPIQGKISYNLKDYSVSGERDYAYFWLRIGVLSLRPLEIFSRIKYVYQEFKYSTKRYCEFYLEENLDFWEGFTLSGKYRADYRGFVAENKEIRVRLQALW